MPSSPRHDAGQPGKKKAGTPRKPHGRTVKGRQTSQKAADEARVLGELRRQNARKAAPKRRQVSRNLSLGQQVGIGMGGEVYESPYSAQFKRAGQDPATR
jgi:hypothetical protein